MPQTKLRLVFDINLYHIKINDIDIIIAPKAVSSFDIDAMVQNQLIEMNHKRQQFAKELKNDDDDAERD